MTAEVLILMVSVMVLAIVTTMATVEGLRVAREKQDLGRALDTLADLLVDVQRFGLCERVVRRIDRAMAEYRQVRIVNSKKQPGIK